LFHLLLKRRKIVSLKKGAGSCCKEKRGGEWLFTRGERLDSSYNWRERRVSRQVQPPFDDKGSPRRGMWGDAERRIIGFSY